MTTTRAGIYARAAFVPPNPSASSAGIARQLDTCTELAAELGFDVVGSYFDDVHTSAPRRPGYDALVADALSGKLDVVIVASLDRLSRLDAFTALPIVVAS